MKLKHTKVATLTATLITFGSLVGGANAALTILVSDAGAGQTQFQLSGSTTVVSSTYSDNELWFNDQDWVSYPTGGVGYYNFTSGGFTTTTTQNGTQNGTRVYYDNSFAFGLEVGFSNFTMSAGDTVSWNGTFTIGVDFSNWSSASYNSPTLDIFGNGGATVTFSESVSVSSSAVPEPSSALLLGFGVLGVAARRRRNR